MIKTTLSLILVPILVYGFFFGDTPEPIVTSAPPPAPTQGRFEQYPPYAKQFLLKQLKTPLQTGENLMVRVRYESDSILPLKLNIYITN